MAQEIKRLKFRLSLKTHESRGWQAMAEEDYSTAISEFETMIKMDPDGLEAYRYLADACLKTSDPQRRLEDYHKAIERAHQWLKTHRRPKDQRAGTMELALLYGSRGILHQREQKYEKALADFDQALKITPFQA